MGEPIDLLVVAIDVDVAVLAGIADPPTRVGGYETRRLHDVLRGWLRTARRRRVPEAVVVSTPVRAIEAWVIAALFPREKSPERIADPAARLVEKKKLRLGRDGKPWKELHRYQGAKGFAARVGQHTGRVRRVCPEAERTFAAIEARRDALSG